MHPNGPGFTDRPCETCGTWTVHRILVPRQRWCCQGCDTIIDRTPAADDPDLAHARAVWTRMLATIMLKWAIKELEKKPDDEG